MKLKMMVFFLLLGSWGAFAQHDHAATDQKMTEQNMPMFKDAKLGSAYGEYVRLKDALVASNAQDAKMGATALQASLKGVKESAKAAEAAGKLAAAPDLDGQRQVFSTLSNEMATLVKGGQLSMGALYLEFCPMANKNAGAYWLSNEKEIKNPYFGSEMLKCGSVKETIN